MAFSRRATGTIFTCVPAELRLLNEKTFEFNLQDATVTASIDHLGDWEYQLRVVDTNGKEWFKRALNADLGYCPHFESRSFTFPDCQGDPSTWTLELEETKCIEFHLEIQRSSWEHAKETLFEYTVEEEEEEGEEQEG
jgi:hypothetical protein